MTGGDPDRVTGGRAVAEAKVTPFVASVRELVARPGPRSATETARAEQLLTDGCALALYLEVDCARIEHEIAELVDRIDEPGAPQQLRMLPARLRGAQSRHAHVRELISVLQASRRAGARTS
jgi:hypothetical protein